MELGLRHPPRLEDHLCFGMYATSIAITRAFKPLLDDLGVTFPQYLALVVLWEEDAQPIGVLAKRLELDSSTITPLIKRLEVVGLVKRQRDKADERIVTAHLTAQGDALRYRAVCVAEHLASLISKPAAEIAAGIEQITDFRHRINAGLPNGQL